MFEVLYGKIRTRNRSVKNTYFLFFFKLLLIVNCYFFNNKIYLNMKSKFVSLLLTMNIYENKIANILKNSKRPSWFPPKQTLTNMIFFLY